MEILGQVFFFVVLSMLCRGDMNNTVKSMRYISTWDITLLMALRYRNISAKPLGVLAHCRVARISWSEHFYQPEGLRLLRSGFRVFVCGRGGGGGLALHSMKTPRGSGDETSVERLISQVPPPHGPRASPVFLQVAAVWTEQELKPNWCVGTLTTEEYRVTFGEVDVQSHVRSFLFCPTTSSGWGEGGGGGHYVILERSTVPMYFGWKHTINQRASLC